MSVSIAAYRESAVLSGPTGCAAGESQSCWTAEVEFRQLWKSLGGVKMDMSVEGPAVLRLGISRVVVWQSRDNMAGKLPGRHRPLRGAVATKRKLGLIKTSVFAFPHNAQFARLAPHSNCSQHREFSHLDSRQLHDPRTSQCLPPSLPPPTPLSSSPMTVSISL